MTTRYDLVVPRVVGDVPRLYVEARVAGIEVSHYSRTNCRAFDSIPAPGSALGVFRTIGALIFYKDERRWEVRARTDAGPVDVSTLISLALEVHATFGRTPGNWTRRRVFRHEVSERTNKRVAWAPICYRLEAGDILGSVCHAEEAPIDASSLCSTVANETVEHG